MIDTDVVNSLLAVIVKAVTVGLGVTLVYCLIFTAKRTGGA